MAIDTDIEPVPHYSRPVFPALRDLEFWIEGAAAGELRIQRCSSCAQLRHPPQPMCPNCRSTGWDTIVATGTGTIYSFIVYHHQSPVGLQVPYTVAVIELPEGVRVVGNLVEMNDLPPAVGLPVEVVFVADRPGSQVLPQWRPAAGGPAS